MARRLAELEEEALGLPPQDRAQLAQSLLRSLDPSAEAEIDRLWIEEAEKRHRDLLDGGTTVPATEAFARARASLK